MLDLILMTAETRTSLGPIERSVRGVTIEAVLVLAELMQAGKPRFLVA